MGVIMKRGINYTGSEGIELTQAEYDALSTEEKNNGTTYFVTDSSGGAIYKNSINYTGDALPDGGTTGQVLMKKSSVGGDVKWGDVGGSITVDSYFSTTSENPVQNKVIKAALDDIVANGVTVDVALDDTSENPVQNKVVKAAIDAVDAKVDAVPEYEAVTAAEAEAWFA